MKKLLIIFSVIMLVVLSVVSVAAESHFDIQVDKDGDGSATYFYDYEKKEASFGCEEFSERFMYWDIDGVYRPIRTENEGKIIVIEPLSDLKVTAVFESAINKPAMPDEVAPQTGQNEDGLKTISLIMLLIVFICAIIAIKDGKG